MTKKEALSVICGVTKFHQYQADKQFKIVTDCKSSTRLFYLVKKVLNK